MARFSVAPCLLPSHPPQHVTGGFTPDTTSESSSTFRHNQSAVPPRTLMFFSERCSRQSSGSPLICPATPADATTMSSKVTFRNRGFPDRWAGGVLLS
ncbi:unnamed protein product [Pseudo-nitzschia multistriata]|uniref:Uncharacterized protein n=1 Tax=Pseudo-nitzschia multistriata TaxID=183589 RepID=A0A448Z052_9STRA|nr:unnamed protein product [Pseudo-nitzschia multistriata]